MVMNRSCVCIPSNLTIHKGMLMMLQMSARTLNFEAGGEEGRSPEARTMLSRLL